MESGRKCKNCGTSIEYKKSNAVYCSDKCKSAYWLYGDNSKKVKSAKDGTINKRDYLRTKHDEPINVIPEVQLRGVIEDNETEQISTPKFIQNPIREKLIKRIGLLKADLFSFKTKMEGLIAKKKELEGKNPILVLTSSGALIGTFWGKSYNRKLDFFTSIGQFALGGLLGAGVGLVVKKQIENEIESITKQLLPSKMSIKQLEESLKIANNFLSILPKLISNPNYTEPLFTQNNNEVSDTGVEEPFNNPNPIFSEPKTSEKIISSEKLKKMNFRSLDFKGNWLKLLGQPEVNFKLAVFGKPGQGKSTFCLQLAHYLANNFGNVLYVSGEEGFSKTLKDKFQNNSAFNKNLHIANIHTYEELIQIVPKNAYPFLIIDSLNNMGIDENKLQEIEEFYSNSAVITISQSTKNGNFRGSQEILHNADITLKVENGSAECTKNRYNPIGFELTVF